MDINDNLQQINTFTKGMNTDVSDMLMDSSQYRYAENVRLVTNTDSNSGELRLVDGTREFSGPSDWDAGDIKAMTSIRDILVIVNNNDEIWTCLYPSTAWKHIFSPADGESFGEYLSLVTRWESEKLVKLYIADGEHQLMYVNLITGDSETIVGIDNITANPAVYIGTVSAELSDRTGNLHPTKVQYCYRLYKEGGAVTTLSPLSNVITLYAEDNTGFPDTTENSGRSVDVELSYSNDAEDSELNNVMLYRLTYKTVDSLPDVALIYEGQTIQQYHDTGNSIEDISYTDFLSYIKLDIIPKVIESKEDYLFAGNISYPKDDINSIPEIDDKKCRAYSSGDPKVEGSNDFDYNGYNLLFDNDKILNYNAEYWRPASNLSQIGGDGEIFSWRLNTSKYVWIDTDNAKYEGEINNLTKTDDLLCSLRSGEVYRYGAIFYDNKGHKSTPKWIADIMIPEHELPQKHVVYNDKHDADKIYYKMLQVGVDFTVNNAQTLLDAGISGIDIVRTPRTVKDRISITRGIAGYPYLLFRSIEDNNFEIAKPTGIVCPTGYLAANMFSADDGFTTESDCLKQNCALTDPNFLMVASPEYAYSPETIKSLLPQGSNVNLIFVDFKYRSYAFEPGVDHFPIDDNLNDLVLLPVIKNYKNEVETADGEEDDIAGDFISAVSLNRNSSRSLWFMARGYTTGLYNPEGDYYEINVLPYENMEYTKHKLPVLIHNQKYKLYDVEIGEHDSIHWVWTYDKDSALQNYLFLLRDLPTTMIYERVLNKFVNTMSLAVIYASKNETLSENPIYIENVAFPNVPDWNGLVDETGTKEFDDVTAIGSAATYMNWGMPLTKGESDVRGHMLNEDGFVSYLDTTDARNAGLIAHTAVMAFTGNIWSAGGIAGFINGIWRSWFSDTVRPVEKRFPIFYPTGSTGQCIVIKLKNPGRVSGRPILNFPVVDIRIKNSIPYGGRNGVDYSSYISSGSVIDISKNLTSVSVYDGDSYPGVFIYNASHAWYYPSAPGAVRQATIYVVPIESDVDLSATYGDLYSRLNQISNHYSQNKASTIETEDFIFQLEKNAYQYNPAYGTIFNTMQEGAVKTSSLHTNTWDTRIHHSGLKTNGEAIDNWLSFSANNFIDVDSRYGLITNLRLFKDKLLFWLDYASGVVSVNERTVLNDIDENQIVLGTGGVLLRFDYISTIHGMKPNLYEAETQSNTTQYWWDGYNKELLAYSGGMELMPLAKLKNITNHINKHNEVGHPSLSYDVKFNELISNVVDGGAIAYNEYVQQFTSIYTFLPIFRSRIGNDLLLSSTDKIYKWNSKLTSDPNVSLLFGQPAKPKVQYVVNKANAYNKVFDITTFGGRFYGGEDAGINNLTFKFDTPLKLHSEDTGSNFITNREYDFRLAIPRNANSAYGDRMRGKTMQCELSSSSNSTDFSLQYIITKFRMSWS